MTPQTKLRFEAKDVEPGATVKAVLVTETDTIELFRGTRLVIESPESFLLDEFVVLGEKQGRGKMMAIFFGPDAVGNGLKLKACAPKEISISVTNIGASKTSTSIYIEGDTVYTET